MGPAPDATELICTSRNNTGPLILQARKRWEKREFEQALFHCWLASRQTWNMTVFHCDMDKHYS